MKDFYDETELAEMEVEELKKTQNNLLKTSQSPMIQSRFTT